MFVENRKISIPITLIMAGGRGSRLGFIEKPLLKICNFIVIERISSIAKRLSKIVLITVSKNTPKLKQWCIENNVDCIYTSGVDYVLDLQFSINVIRKRPLLILPGDLPFLNESTLIEFIVMSLVQNSSIITLCVDKDFYTQFYNFDSLDSSLKDFECIPVGISLIKGFDEDWTNVIINRFPDFLNLNTSQDLEFAKRICEKMNFNFL